ncbi:MAG: cupredoxin domain-containing protein [bacterium]
MPISMKNSTFTPSTTTIKVGTTIVWTNDDSTQHSVYASGAFDDIILQPGETFSYTFKTAGSFNYVSTLQKNMIGKIIVE